MPGIGIGLSPQFGSRTRDIGIAALAPFAASGTGAVDDGAFLGAADAALAPFAATGSGSETFSGSSSAALAPFACSGSGSATNFHEQVDMFLASGTYTTPAAPYRAPDGTDLGVLVECWAAGGGGTTATGAGGGGEFATSTVTTTASTGYSVTVGTGAANADGGDSSFNSTTVVAKGGKSGANGSTGGTGGTGTTLRAGGNGQTGSGSNLGGGSSGTSSAASGVTPGGPDGALDQASAQVGDRPGAGGGSQAAAQVAGGTGLVYVHAMVPQTAGFPFVKAGGRTHGRDTADTTSRNITLPSGSGGTLLVWVVSDGIPTISMSGDWTALTQVDEDTSNVSGRWFWQHATGSETVAVTTSSSQQAEWRVWRVFGAAGGQTGTPEQTTASGSSTNADAPSHTPSGGSASYLWIAAAGWDQTNGNWTFTGTPASYTSNLLVPSYTNVGGVRLAACERFLTASSENPGSWTSGNEQWVAATLSIPPS